MVMKWALSTYEITNNSFLDLLLMVTHASKGIISYIILILIFVPLFWKLSRTNDDTGLAMLKAGWLTFLPSLLYYYLGIWIQDTYATSIRLLPGQFILVYVFLLAVGTGFLYYDRTEQ